MTLDIETERRALALFRRLLDNPPADPDWASVLSSESPAVADCVRALHARHGSPTRRLEAGFAMVWEGDPPTQLGGFALGRELGRGGMGMVLEGVRDLGGLQQRAAIKLIAGGKFDAGRRARFLLEREVVARLQHPQIARLLDGGEGPGGELWYAMELIDGDTLIGHCESRGLGPRQRVALLLDLCEAVAHAHRHSILHRDIKPGNVLVDAEGHLSLIDFGIAKSLDAVDDGLTRDRAPMTPRYAAPEQLRGERPTTSSDIWQLGALAYELLAGVPAREQPNATVVPPSRHPALVADPACAARRRELAGDLDAILMRALRDEPEHRYGSVDQFAADLRQWLRRRPVSARRGERGYVFRRFVRTHRWAVGFAAVAAVAVLAGGISAALLAREARRQAEDAEQVAALLTEMFVSGRSAPTLPSMSLRDFFAHAVGIALTDARLSPMRRCDLLYSLAVRAKDLYAFDLAERAARGLLQHAPEVSGPASIYVAVGHDFVASTSLLARGHSAIPEAEQHLAQAETLYRNLDLLDNVEYKTSHLRERIRLEQIRGDAPAMLQAARRAMQAVQDLRPDKVLNMQVMVVWALMADEQHAAAAAEAAAIVDATQRAAVQLPALNNMLDWQQAIACRAEARHAPRAALQRCGALLTGRENAPITRIAARAQFGLGEAQAALGDATTALDTLRSAESMLLALEGEDVRSAELQGVREALARQLFRSGEAASAATQQTALVAQRTDYLGPQHPDTLRVAIDLAESLQAQGQHYEAAVQLAMLQTATLSPSLATRLAALRDAATSVRP